MLIRERLEYAPTLYKKGAKKKRYLGIFSFEIEIIVNSSQNEYLKNNFIGVFPSDKMTKFINFHSMMRE